MRDVASQRYPRSCLAACLLPWTADWKLDRPAFANHVETTLEDGYRCLYILGTAGEGYALSEAMYKQVTRIFADLTLDRECDPQVGIIGTSMQHMIERIDWAHGLGFRMFQVSLSSWGTLNEDETLIFFETVCGAFPDSRFLHYNLPRARRLVTGPEYRRIADVVPNLVATKNNRTELETQDIVQYAPDLQHFLLETNFSVGCTIAPCSLLCSYGMLFPNITRQLYDAGSRLDIPVLSRITEFLQEFATALFANCGPDMMDGVYDKTYLWLRDANFPTRILPPFRGHDVGQLRRCREIYDHDFHDADSWDFSEAAYPKTGNRRSSFP